MPNKKPATITLKVRDQILQLVFQGVFRDEECIHEVQYSELTGFLIAKGDGNTLKDKTFLRVVRLQNDQIEIKDTLKGTL